jgi:hypothetical protein
MEYDEVWRETMQEFEEAIGPLMDATMDKLIDIRPAESTDEAYAVMRRVQEEIGKMTFREFLALSDEIQRRVR